MDLSQTKLTRSEWNSIEIPTEKKELDIIKLICAGYHNVNTVHNNTLTLLQYLKIDQSDIIHQYVYCTYLQKDIINMKKKYNFEYTEISLKKNKMKKADIIRFSNTDKQLGSAKSKIFEYIVIQAVNSMLNAYNKSNIEWQKYYYTIDNLMRYRVTKVNPFFRNTVINILELYEPHLKIKELVYHASDLIEQNPALMTYGDITLYDHQKELFTICKHKHPKLISYIAPTGTGKTMSPIGLSENNRIIFVCAARHVGLALAKAAISSEKKVAFAFGCNSCDDIRLHYFAATDYVRNRRSGMIAKVDNSVGDKVEIMICDLKSYLCAMYYMLAFNKKEDIILYWDEPTISMDYVEHEIHPIIHDNWSKNEIPNIVLSSATLPTRDEISETIQDFTSRFDGAEFYNINSYDCKKTIPIINKEGYVDMPHYIAESYSDMVDIIRHCKENKTLLRYIDLKEAIRLIKLINDKDYVCKERYTIEEYFSNIGDVTMVNIKQYYLELLESLDSKAWEHVSSMIIETRKRRHKSNILVVTEDAHTLTDGPTIFLADNIDKISDFCIKYANIPKRVEDDIMNVIEYNTLLNNKISSMQRTLEDGTRSDDEKEKKMSEGRVAPAMKQLIEKINEAQRCVKSVELASIFVPNTDENN